MVQARLTHTQPITSRIVLTRFTLDKPLKFRAGQHIMVGFTTASGERVERPFSIASTPTRRGEIEFMVELRPNSLVGDFFSNVKEGSRIELRDPKGVLTVGVGNRPLHFIAAGMGLAPFRSICQDLFGRGYEGHVRLSHLREPGSWGLIDEELTQLHKKWKNFSYSLIHTSVEQAMSEGWQWRHVSLGQPSVGEFSYVCGSPAFVEALSSEMRSRGFTAEQIVTGG